MVSRIFKLFSGFLAYVRGGDIWNESAVYKNLLSDAGIVAKVREAAPYLTSQCARILRPPGDYSFKSSSISDDWGDAA